MAIRYVLLGHVYSRVIRKSGSHEDYLKESCDTKQLKRILRRYERWRDEGQLVHRTYREPHELMRGLFLAYDVSTKSWKAKGNTHIGSSSRTGRYHRELFSYFAAKKMLTVHILFHHERPIAFQIVIHHEEECYFVKTAYDREYGKYSPGNITFYLVVRDLFREERVKKMNLRTDYPYMGIWTPHREEFRSIAIFNERPKSRTLYHLVKISRPIITEIRRRTGLRLLSHPTFSV
jgi:hypothetical protein